MDPAWLAYYQSMSYYSMMQASMAGATSSGTETGTTTTATDSTAASGNNSTTPGRSIFHFFFFYAIKYFFFLAINPTTGQPDYSQQWIEYYRSIGQNDVAEQIMQQMKEVRHFFATVLSMILFLVWLDSHIHIECKYKNLSSSGCRRCSTSSCYDDVCQ
jgi:F0F1-type ATP synthase membrane subunit a